MEMSVSSLPPNSVVKNTDTGSTVVKYVIHTEMCLLYEKNLFLSHAGSFVVFHSDRF